MITKHKTVIEDFVKKRAAICASFSVCSSCPLYSLGKLSGEQYNICHNFRYLALNAAEYINTVANWHVPMNLTLLDKEAIEEFVIRRAYMCTKSASCIGCALLKPPTRTRKADICHNFKFLADNATWYVNAVLDWREIK